jgi:hypothetical protein
LQKTHGEVLIHVHGTRSWVLFKVIDNAAGIRVENPLFRENRETSDEKKDQFQYSEGTTLKTLCCFKTGPKRSLNV